MIICRHPCILLSAWISVDLRSLGAMMSCKLSKWHLDIDRYLNPILPRPPWHWLPYPVSHFLGHRTTARTSSSLGNIPIIFWAAIGIFCGLTLVEVVGHQIPAFRDHGAPLIIGSFVCTYQFALLATAPESYAKYLDRAPQLFSSSMLSSLLWHSHETPLSASSSLQLSESASVSFLHSVHGLRRSDGWLDLLHAL